MIRSARQGRRRWTIGRVDLAYLLGLIAGALLTAAIVLDAHPSVAERIGTSDFAYIWSGPRAILESDNPHHPLRWARRTTDLITPVYSYPPPVALALRPLALLPLTTGWFVWTVAPSVADVRGGFVTFYAFVPAAIFLISAVACWPRRRSLS